MTEWKPARKRPVEVQYREVHERQEIDTREGTLIAEPGDYLIKGVEGEIYPIDPDIFEQTYERIIADDGAGYDG